MPHFTDGGYCMSWFSSFYHPKNGHTTKGMSSMNKMVSGIPWIDSCGLNFGGQINLQFWAIVGGIQDVNSDSNQSF